jgi:hypothetical protein
MTEPSVECSAYMAHVYIQCNAGVVVWKVKEYIVRGAIFLS